MEPNDFPRQSLFPESIQSLLVLILISHSINSATVCLKLTYSEQDIVFVLDKMTVGVDESLWVELSGIFKDFRIVHDVIQVGEDHGVLGKVILSVCGLHVFCDPVRYAEADDGRVPGYLVYDSFCVVKVVSVAETRQPVKMIE